MRSHLQTLDVPVQVTRDVNPIQVLPARTLSSMYQQLGKSTMLPLFLHCHTLRLAEKIAHIFLNESGLNLKQIVTDSRSFTRAFWRLQVIVSKAVIGSFEFLRVLWLVIAHFPRFLTATGICIESWLVYLNFCACDWSSVITKDFSEVTQNQMNCRENATSPHFEMWMTSKFVVAQAFFHAPSAQTFNIFLTYL